MPVEYWGKVRGVDNFRLYAVDFRTAMGDVVLSSRAEIQQFDFCLASTTTAADDN